MKVDNIARLISNESCRNHVHDENDEGARKVRSAVVVR